MLDELKEDTIVERVGGRFRLATLVQKRMIQLNRGAKPLVPAEGRPLMAVVLQEILQGKISLDATGAALVFDDMSRGGAPVDIDE